MQEITLELRRVGLFLFEAQSGIGGALTAGSGKLKDMVDDRYDPAMLETLPKPQTDLLPLRPMQLLLAAHAGCAAIDIVLILTKQKEPVGEFVMKMHGIRKEGTPAPYEKIDIEVTAPGVDPRKLHRAVELGVRKYCSVGASLDPAIAIDIAE